MTRDVHLTLDLVYKRILAGLGRHEEKLHRSLQMRARLQPFCISRLCGAPFLMTAAMFVDAALPHPGC